MQWANYIKLIRTQRFLKQEALANILGVSQGSVSRWERGVSLPSPDMQRSLQALWGDVQLCSNADKALSFLVRQSESMVLIDRSMVFRDASHEICRAFQRSVSDVIGRRNDKRMTDEGQTLRDFTHTHLHQENVVFAKMVNGGYAKNGNILYTLSDIAPIRTSCGDDMLLISSKFISHDDYVTQKRKFGGQLKFWTVEHVE